MKVSDRGELVVLEIGNCAWSIEFVTALELAALIQREARYAKASAGDGSFRHSVAGVLHDASAAKNRATRFRKELPERLAKKNISVLARGQVVHVRIRHTEIGLPYGAASKVAQWIRIHGKIARNAAGETTHWSQLVSRHALEARR